MPRPVRFLIVLILPLTLRAQLQWPAITSQTKPWTRWWWMGSAVNPSDLTANLQKYHDAGLGGLELTPIYGVKGYENQFVDYLSPKWMNLLSFTLKEAKRLDLGLDMSTGTGWPFGGGPLIDSTYACRELFVKTWTIRPGDTIPADLAIYFRQEPYVHTDGRPAAIEQLKEPIFANKELQALAPFQVRFPDLAPLQVLMAYSSDGRIVSLTNKLDTYGHLHWPGMPDSSTWTLYGLFLGWHGKMVERAAPGAEGNVIDHFSSTALHKYLSRFDTAFAGHDLSPLRCFFNDSYEVDDSRGQSNWTQKFLAAFYQHRGYYLQNHLPALFGRDTKENNSRVLCDYRETISDLLLEQFTQPWHDWAHSKGALIRNQAHGSPANILDLYAASDIPETEGQDILRYKFATSAAHVTRKRLASAETVTWLNEHFLSTYGDVKKALDGFFLGGVNHVFYHGTAYTPLSDPFPGWLFYASVHFTPNDPSWPDFSALNQYVSRVQSFLQQGTPDNDVLLYFPIYDSWSEPGNALLKHYDRMDPEFSNTGFKECAEYLQTHGYGFDYISDKQLQQTLLPQYKTIILPDCHYMPVATIQHLIALEKQGVNILVYKHPPTSAPGLDPSAYPQTTFPTSADLGSLLKDIPAETLVDDSLACIRRNYGNGKAYFIVNNASKPFGGFVPLNTKFTAAGIFDPMTGEKGLAHIRDHSVYLQLRPGETCLVETNVAPRGPLFTYYHPSGAPIPLKAGPQPDPFTDSAKYTIAFDRPGDDAAAWLLDLGKVVRNAEISLNGQHLATLIGPEYRLTIPAERLKTRNTLLITVRGGMVNHIIELDRKHVPWKKFYNYNFPAHDRANRGADGLFDASKWTPLEEGLLGPISLTPMTKI